MKHLPPSPVVYAERLLEIIEKAPKLNESFIKAFKMKNFDNMNSYSEQIYTMISAVYNLYWFDRKLLPFHIEYRSDWRLDQGIKMELSKLYKAKQRLKELEERHDIEKFIGKFKPLITIYRNILNHTMRIVIKGAVGKNDDVYDKSVIYDMEGKNNKERMKELRKRAGMFLGKEVRDNWEDAGPKEVLMAFIEKANDEGLI